MSGPFRLEAGRVTLRLGSGERAALMSVPVLLEDGADAGGRLDYTAHPDDPEADRRYRDLVAGDLDDLRRDDRAAFDQVVAAAPVEPDAIEAFMRVIGEARLVLAAHLGIEDDGWEYETVDDPEMALLGWLGWLQDAAVRTLMDLL